MAGSEREITPRKSSIATKWLLNSFIVSLFAVAALVLGVYTMAHSYYYAAVSRYLFSEANTIAGILNYLDAETNAAFSNEVRESVELFEKKDLMELMAIDNNGSVSISSSGFSPENEEQMPDYTAALSSAEGRGEYVGYLSRSDSKEKYMAVSVKIYAKNSDYSAIRIMTGLEKVDAYIRRIVLLSAAGGAAVLLLVLIMGLYFVKSIIKPVREMSNSAKELAKGNFLLRIPVKGNDEIAQLCKAFNSMADDLANSESIKNDFISSVSHELRTPLTAIKGWSETIMEMHDEQTLSRGMKVITEETERLSAMVEELLDFSRIQNNQLKLQKANIDLLAELTDAVLVYTERARKNDIVLSYIEPEGIAPVYGDKNRLRQVFINIIDNAVKYTGRGGIISVEAQLFSGKAEIRISDSGCGISAEDLPKVKNRFYKANNTVRGSGIGLAVADEIVSRHNGVLNIESVLGEGTTVTVILPLLQGKGDDS